MYREMTHPQSISAVVLRTCIASACLAAILPAAAQTPSSADGTAWSGKAAAAYLDGRLTWWMGWPQAARDHETFCVSCHTVATYAMGRPALRSALGEPGPSPTERRVLDNVLKRVRMWKEVAPFYPDATRGVPKTA